MPLNTDLWPTFLLGILTPILYFWTLLLPDLILSFIYGDPFDSIFKLSFRLMTVFYSERAPWSCKMIIKDPSWVIFPTSGLSKRSLNLHRIKRVNKQISFQIASLANLMCFNGGRPSLLLPRLKVSSCHWRGAAFFMIANAWIGYAHILSLLSDQFYLILKTERKKVWSLSGLNNLIECYWQRAFIVIKYKDEKYLFRGGYSQ